MLTLEEIKEVRLLLSQFFDEDKKLEALAMVLEGDTTKVKQCIKEIKNDK